MAAQSSSAPAAKTGAKPKEGLASSGTEGQGAARVGERARRKEKTSTEVGGKA